MNNRTSRATIRKRKTAAKPIDSTLKSLAQEALDIDAQIAELDERRKQLRERIYDYLPEESERYSDGNLYIRKVLPRTAEVFSPTICQTLYGNIYEECKVEKDIKGYITISII